ncbi:hypothetical protein ACVWWN_003438 [Mycobacterium sp. URHB0021]|jgi:hypothetical protein
MVDATAEFKVRCCRPVDMELIRGIELQPVPDGSPDRGGSPDRLRAPTTHDDDVLGGVAGEAGAGTGTGTDTDTGTEGDEPGRFGPQPGELIGVRIHGSSRWHTSARLNRLSLKTSRAWA